MVISMLKIRRPLGRLIFNMGIAIPGKTVFLIETAPSSPKWSTVALTIVCDVMVYILGAPVANTPFKHNWSSSSPATLLQIKRYSSVLPTNTYQLRPLFTRMGFIVFGPDRDLGIDSLREQTKWIYWIVNKYMYVSNETVSICGVCIL